MNNVTWITKNGKHIPITNEYMNNKIRSGTYTIEKRNDPQFKNYKTMTYYQGNKKLDI